MNFSDILIVGIVIGGSIIFTMFAFFRDFFLGYANRGDGYYARHESNLNSNLIFIIAFIVAIVLFVKYFSPNKGYSQIKPVPKKEQILPLTKQANMFASNKLTEPSVADISDDNMTKAYFSNVNISPSKEQKNISNNFAEPISSKIKTYYSIQVAANRIEEYAYENARVYINRFKQPVFLMKDHRDITKVLVGKLEDKNAALIYKKRLEKNLKKELFLIEIEDSK